MSSARSRNMEQPEREQPPGGAVAKRVCFKQEQEVRFVEKWAGEGSSPQAEDHEDTAADLDCQYSKDEVEKIRRRKKVLAAGVGSLGYGVGDTEVDTVNLRSAAVAASEADPEVEKDEKGIVFEPFNMRREMQEGVFDEEGNYLWRTKQPAMVADGWLDAIDAGDASTAFRTEEARQRALSEMCVEAEATVVDIPESLRELAELLGVGESPTDAMRRIKAAARERDRASGEARRQETARRERGNSADGARESKRRREEEEEDDAFCRPTAKRTRRKKREEDSEHLGSEEPEGEEKAKEEANAEKEEANAEKEEANAEKKEANAEKEEEKTPEGERGERREGFGRKDARVSKRREANGGRMNEDELRVFNAITDLCSSLMAVGKNVYFLRKEDILNEIEKSVKPATDDATADTESEAAHAEDGNSGEAATLWQFRWLNNPSDTALHGPYPSSLFRAWIEQGFVSDETAMEVRQVSASNDPLDGLWLSWRDADFRSAREQEEDERRREAEEDERQREADSDEERAQARERRRKESKERGEENQEEEEEAKEEKEFRKNERVMRMLQQT
ncbi:putative CD2 antigen cytoplasmic tail-binding protein 2 [Toxoplasma gondii TgCatPRC2]|uniref:CD2 antigen cytoplasmic tail-binding protein 2 n=7 Tax=Toxoplasma gondii TaxID=5811 RepID=A0A125YRA6_TOXGV|nr:hypothetical protein TGME49_217010 [Toxoplasma gondii ME49]ESS28755.1 putative CD2 antigen cytoplasmic tail-binding protein 2 [Toxoplasma gondii VEG]KFG32246.1 putative CD2 antigen cytoplasmic tail-binding protein 2 [Toxoplasma gondii FOU]KFG32396.1 putative CD2 antigen cytoplasmic tail-binding protein 2 [Toxoplasma gondii GAB2-2007-GAL-DOM2]KYK64466.1 putative CD2 antigen cytoplasmic tail-binding protein 2 [Toxoplasma gondii TgCatPRC2]PUA83879.1 putative CD2 antigen cytoplasmic tail-bindin|eukprot:XP_002371009.2 hypothetical protein TGME49_217010 [Toxoplasma gondii ME49]